MIINDGDNGSILVLHWGQTGAGPDFTWQITRELAAKDKPTVFASVNANADNFNRYSDVLGEEHIWDVTTYRTRREVVTGLPRLFRTALHIRKLIQKYEISTVVSPMESIYQSLALYIWLPRKIRYVSLIHDAQNHPGDEHLIKRIGHWFELKRADQIATLSNYVSQQLRDIGISPKRVVTSRHPVMGDEIADRPKSQPIAPITIGFFGRLIEYKGLRLFCEVAELLNKKHPGKFVFEVYGDGPLGYLAEEYPQSVKWHIGWISPEEVTSVIDGLDVLLMPYLEASQSGVFNQALGRGIPVVATPVGGLIEQVDAGENGLLADSCNVEHIADAVEQLVDSGKYEQYSANALFHAKTDFTWERLTNVLVRGKVESE